VTWHRRPVAPGNHIGTDASVAGPDQTLGTGTARAVLLVTILVVAANLRPTITALGSVVGLVAADTGMGAGAIGLLGAVPLLAFAVVSPIVHVLTRAMGAERAVLVSTLVLIVATVVRSLPGSVANLWLGTVVMGAAIAVGNVVVPELVKRDFPTDVPLVTGLYSTVLGASAAVASGLALPIAEIGGWRLGIGIWVLFSVVAALVWPLRMRSLAIGGSAVREPEETPSSPPVGGGTGRSVWRSAVAWQVSLIMATQGLTYFMLVTWLPTIEVSMGIDPVTAGWHSFLYQIVGIAAGLGVTPFMRARSDHRAVGVVISLLLVVAVLGLLFAPDLLVLWLVVAGLSGGSSLVLALALVGERSPSATDAGRLSGMAQSVGYLLAAAGPFGAGVLFAATGSWSYPLLAVIAVAIFQLVLSLLAGRDRLTHQAEPDAASTKA
jgi:CP family cyanate transporter-like MFS transporter